MTEPGLFEVPDDAYVLPPVRESLTRGERRARLVATRITTGVHPLGRPVLLHPQAARYTEPPPLGQNHPGDQPRCGTCVFRVLLEHHNRTYPKCWYPDNPDAETDTPVPHPRDTHCESSDIRAWWPGCREYQAKAG